MHLDGFVARLGVLLTDRFEFIERVQPLVDDAPEVVREGVLDSLLVVEFLNGLAVVFVEVTFFRTLEFLHHLLEFGNLLKDA